MPQLLFQCIVSVAMTVSLTGCAARSQAQAGGDNPTHLNALDEDTMALDAKDYEAAWLAAATVRYEDATKDLDAKNYEAACPKLEEVVELAPQGIGGLLTLAECYEAEGKLASAFAAFARAEVMAAEAKQLDRQKEAHDQVVTLSPKLAKLTITVAEGIRSLAGLKVRRDGARVAPAQWGVAVPINKGQHFIVATAPGKQSWEKAITLSSDGMSETVTLGAMIDANVATTAPPPPKPAPIFVELPASQR